MIAHIKGKVSIVASGYIIIEVSGLGFQVFVARAEQFGINSDVQLYTYLHWNQEQGPSVFGFCSQAEKVVFELIISCSGIGPKIALAVLHDLAPIDFFNAIGTHDIKILSSISGIGAKKAEQMVVQLKHKVAKVLESGLVMENKEGIGSAFHLKDISDALASLNYSRAEISHAINHLHQQVDLSSYSFDQLFRQALSFLSKRS